MASNPNIDCTRCMFSDGKAICRLTNFFILVRKDLDEMRPKWCPISEIYREDEKILTAMMSILGKVKPDDEPT